jgi:hypothetical protein
MKLENFDRKNVAQKALKENFNHNFDFSKLNKAQTREMLVKFDKVIKESKKKNGYDSHKNPTYLKAIMIAEALSNHYRTLGDARIVVENTEVEKSQVILAAQDLVDQIQKMVEQVNDMLVKELPALADSIQSEIGVQEGNSYNEAASGSLTQLNSTLSETRTALQNALNQLTGMAGPGDFGAAPAGGEEVAVTDIAAGPGGEEVAGAELETPPMPAEEPEAPVGGGVGRAKR